MTEGSCGLKEAKGKDFDAWLRALKNGHSPRFGWPEVVELTREELRRLT